MVGKVYPSRINDFSSAVWFAEFSLLVEFSYATGTESLKKAVADPTSVQSIKEQDGNYVLIFVKVDNVVYMGTVTNSNMTWHVLICVASND